MQRPEAEEDASLFWRRPHVLRVGMTFRCVESERTGREKEGEKGLTDWEETVSEVTGAVAEPRPESEADGSLFCRDIGPDVQWRFGGGLRALNFGGETRIPSNTNTVKRDIAL